MLLKAYMPAVRSAIGMPGLAGRSGQPVVAIEALSACTMRSYARLSAYGPDSPYPEMSQPISRGCRALSCRALSPRPSAVPGARFCTTTSADAISSSRMAPAGRVLEVERERLLAAVDPHEVRGHAADLGVVVAGEVAFSHPFDLDDARPHVRKLSRRERGADGLLERDDDDAG